MIETTECSGGDCVAVESIGSDWFWVRSTINKLINLALTGDELRAFLTQVKAGQFDEIAGLAPDTTVGELQAENAELRADVEALRAQLLLTAV